ncbi:MAG TPA: hypothetical protein PKA64_02765 [Myxococcota bacterium]|nr:hypothetical protein [Myxococcota bacterium]
MAYDEDLIRLNPFEGLCLTAADMLAEQRYHRRSLERHARFLSGHGVVQGLSVELEQRLDRYDARIRVGYGLTAHGQGVHLPVDLTFRLEDQATDGDYVLWLVREEQPDPDAVRPVYDTSDRMISARIVETVGPRLLPQGHDVPYGVALAHIRVRLGRMTRLNVPVPRAGRVLRAAESALKPQVLRFVTASRRVLSLLYRTTVLQELSVNAFGFYSALVSAEFLLIEEGTPDRVLYRTAGTLMGHARGFYDSDEVREMTERLFQVAEVVRAVADAVPEPYHEDREWQRWFEQFERVLPPLDRTVAELVATVDPTKEHDR